MIGAVGPLIDNMQVKIAADGEILTKSASISDNNYSFLVTTQNGHKYYFQAQVMNFKVNLGSVDSITAASVNLELTTSSTGVGVVEDLAA